MTGLSPIGYSSSVDVFIKYRVLSGSPFWPKSPGQRGEGMRNKASLISYGLSTWTRISSSLAGPRSSLKPPSRYVWHPPSDPVLLLSLCTLWQYISRRNQFRKVYYKAKAFSHVLYVQTWNSNLMSECALARKNTFLFAGKNSTHHFYNKHHKRALVSQIMLESLM